MVSQIAVDWLNQRAAQHGDAEPGIVFMVPLKNVSAWDQHSTPTGSWYIRREVKDWFHDHKITCIYARDQSEKNAFFRFPAGCERQATHFKLIFG
jgi:hypothetical protein